MADAGIVRNRLKIASAVTNAQAFLAVQKEFGSFDQYICSFVDGKPIQNGWRPGDPIPARTAQSDALSKALLKRGFRFVGSTICYAFMQAHRLGERSLRGLPPLLGSAMRRPLTAREAARKLLRAPKSATRDASFRKAIRPDPQGQGRDLRASGRGGRLIRSITGKWRKCCAVRAARCPGSAWWGAGGEIKLKFEAGMEQRTRLEMEGVRFRGKRVDIVEHQHRFRPWEFEELD